MLGNDWKYSINSKTFDDLEEEEFKNFKFKTVLSYLLDVIIINVLKIAFFVSDIYTCVKLLAYNSWSNNVIKPFIPFRVTKWLFSACIFASIVLLIIEAIMGIRIYRTRNISLTYVNNFSRNAYSVKSYSKFCIYNKLTPKGFFQKISFFTFFELKNCLRLLFADTPRQVFNGLTLWSVLVSAGNGTDLGDLESFSGLINKIKEIAQSNHAEAVILSFMLFSFILWAFFMFKFILALLCSIIVYYNLIRKHRYGSLKVFVCITINKKVDDMVSKHRNIAKTQNMFNTGLLQSTSMLDINKDLERNTTETSFDLPNIPSFNSEKSIPNMIQTNSSDFSIQDDYEMMTREPEIRNSVIYGQQFIDNAAYHNRSTPKLVSNEFNTKQETGKEEIPEYQETILEVESGDSFDPLDYHYDHNSIPEINTVHLNEQAHYSSTLEQFNTENELDKEPQSTIRNLPYPRSFVSSAPPSMIEADDESLNNSIKNSTLTNSLTTINLHQRQQVSKPPPPPINLQLINGTSHSDNIYTPDRAYFRPSDRNFN
ncbi:Low affinity K(+) transporter 1 [Nakaseomyces bracarensis]|uniref:Low affinity K(+) transporter 1 n=1 Tax=Nakaseomyces bracarensis TaxID=273131 RepID=A0ABR4NTP2_9SACH